MKRTTIAFSLLLLVLCSGAALSGEREGSTPEDLAALNPPPPNDVYVAVLPFWGRNETQTTLARACTILNLMRHGFRLAPSGSKSLAGVVRRTDSAIRDDSEYDPLSRLDGGDAARIGKALGARWAVCGEFGEMQTVSKDGKVLPRKISQIDLRLSLIDVGSGRVLYWSRVKDTHSGSFSLLKKASSMERRLITRTVNGIFDDIAIGLPEHYTGSQVTPEEVKQLAASLDR
jgi:hypothetical protein